MKIPIQQIIEQTQDYISASAKKAADSFALMGHKHEFFEGTGWEITTDMCEKFYLELLNECGETGQLLVQKHGLIVALVPLQCELSPVEDPENRQDIVVYRLHCGIFFPDVV